MATHDEIAAKAYQLWEQAGKPQGRETEFWTQAVAILTGTGKKAPSTPHAAGDGPRQAKRVMRGGVVKMLPDDEDARIRQWLGNDDPLSPLFLSPLYVKLTDGQKKQILSIIELTKDQPLGGPADRWKLVSDILLKDLEAGCTTRVSLPWEEPSRPEWLSPHRGRLGLDPSLLFRSFPASKSCDRCDDTIRGKYYTLEGEDLCRRCMRRVRIRRKMLAAKPNRQVKSLLKAAMKDLRRAARYDRQDQQIKTNFKNIRPLLSSAGGSGVAYAAFWVPLWLVVALWDCLISLLGLIACAIGGPFAVYWLWKQGGDIRTTAVVLGIIGGLAVLCGGMRLVRNGLTGFLDGVEGAVGAVVGATRWTGKKCDAALDGVECVFTKLLEAVGWALGACAKGFDVGVDRAIAGLSLIMRGAIRIVAGKGRGKRSRTKRQT
jgi:hypothetical protein